MVEMDTGKRENKTEGVPPIIASSGAEISFIFTHYEVFVLLPFKKIQQRTKRYGLSSWLMKALNVGSETLKGFKLRKLITSNKKTMEDEKV